LKEFARHATAIRISDGMPLGHRLQCAPAKSGSCWWATATWFPPISTQWHGLASARHAVAQREIQVATCLHGLPWDAAGLQTPVQAGEGREQLVGHGDCGAPWHSMAWPRVCAVPHGGSELIFATHFKSHENESM